MLRLCVMLRWSFAGLLILTAMVARAQEAPRPQVLFSFDRKSAESKPTTPAHQTQISNLETQALTNHAAPIPRPTEPFQQAPTVVVVQAEMPIDDPPSDPRRLAPPSPRSLTTADGHDVDRIGKLPFEMPRFDSLGTAMTGLVLVVGLFLLCMSLMRKAGPSPTTPLPYDAVVMLGRIPLAPKRFAHLLQVGNKLVLVSICGDRTDTITEITDPSEVDRLLAICMKGNKHGTSVEFQRVLDKMAREPARGFLGSEASTAYARTARG